MKEEDKRTKDLQMCNHHIIALCVFVNISKV